MSANPNVLHWLCHGDFSFCLLAWLILILVSSRKVFATLSLWWPPLTQTHINWCPCRNAVSKSYSLWCFEWCLPNRSILVIAVFYHRPQCDLKSFHKNVTDVAVPLSIVLLFSESRLDVESDGEKCMTRWRVKMPWSHFTLSWHI
jgi:hypothetical protein